jgi:serine/threonine protein kinase
MQTVGGRYALDGRLGEGGMGQVYRARHLQLGKAFALKLIAPAFADDSDARARFNQEAKLASEISHPNIVSVVDFGEDATFGAYMVMELVEGEPLVTHGSLPMSVKRALDILAQVADALDHIHRRGIIHGDVKADNIMLSGENDGARRRRVARLLDFGLARRGGTAHDEEHSGGVSGSPHYLAPERAAGGPPSMSTDIYALGVLAYLMFTGTLPFEGSVVEVLMAHIHEAPPQPSKRLGEEIDEAIEAMILRAMAKDPSKRHGSAAAFRYELNAVMEMLDMGRRRARGTGSKQPGDDRESLVQQAFDRSRLPQALVSVSGLILTANKSFVKLVGQEGTSLDNTQISETPLMQFVPGLMRAIKSVHVDHKPIERRARVFRGADTPPLELIIVLSPLPMAGCEVHMIIRVEEVDARTLRDER